LLSDLGDRVLHGESFVPTELDTFPCLVFGVVMNLNVINSLPHDEGVDEDDESLDDNEDLHVLESLSLFECHEPEVEIAI